MGKKLVFRLFCVITLGIQKIRICKKIFYSLYDNVCLFFLVVVDCIMRVVLRLSQVNRRKSKMDQLIILNYYFMVNILMVKNSGGQYDENSIELRDWVEVLDGYNHNRQLTFFGVYKKGKKVEFWIDVKISIYQWRWIL
ncbi:unnamed protein product [Paramecium pentaurelia]|uniref:Uncharacterized protein n=1 Tax=Paramecium pentaurelia TaxID=43138 RepID=A0A8S1UNI5_9CILI|nr:unnamed protein product [Paramecium pentaurelia]